MHEPASLKWVVAHSRHSQPRVEDLSLEMDISSPLDKGGGGGIVSHFCPDVMTAVFVVRCEQRG